jgi:hypothetical protein
MCLIAVGAELNSSTFVPTYCIADIAVGGDELQLVELSKKGVDVSTILPRGGIGLQAPREPAGAERLSHYMRFEFLVENAKFGSTPLVHKVVHNTTITDLIAAYENFVLEAVWIRE